MKRTALLLSLLLAWGTLTQMNAQQSRRLAVPAEVNHLMLGGRFTLDIHPALAADSLILLVPDHCVLADSYANALQTALSSGAYAMTLGHTLSISDTSAQAVYTLYANEQQIGAIQGVAGTGRPTVRFHGMEPSMTLLGVDATQAKEGDTAATAVKRSQQEKKTDELMTLIDSVITVVGKMNDRKGYSFGQRSNWDFYWGFNNWGTTPLSGLMGMDDPAYDLRTSFSSYQLGYHYAFLMTKHWQMKVGVAYESDVYKYHTPYVSTHAPGAATASGLYAQEPPREGGWESRMVARYVDMPLTLSYRTKNHGGFRVNLAAIPGLSFNGRHTGLKHICTNAGRTQKESPENLTGMINPFKLDLRLDLNFRGLGVFLQVPTMPLFVGEGIEKVYPIKVGFRI